MKYGEHYFTELQRSSSPILDLQIVDGLIE